jgi:hypothetical protein
MPTARSPDRRQGQSKRERTEGSRTNKGPLGEEKREEIREGKGWKGKEENEKEKRMGREKRSKRRTQSSCPPNQPHA